MKAVIRQQVDIEFVMKLYAKKLFDHHEAQEGLAEWTANLKKWPEIDRLFSSIVLFVISVGDSRRIKHQR